jgi:TM2 domain-containing membrane protein YozV
MSDVPGPHDPNNPPPQPEHSGQPPVNYQSNVPGMPDRSEANSKKILSGVLGIVLGGLGIHKFVLGITTPAIIMLVVSIVGYATSCLVIPIFASIAMSIIGLVEGIIYLTKSDDEFFQTYMVEKKQWF